MIARKEIQKYELICANAESNKNKFWRGILYDDGTAASEYGRVGYDIQRTEYPSHVILEKKQKGKLKKGYVQLKTIGNTSSGAPKIVERDNLSFIAKQQLARNNPQLDALIERLVQANIHNITSNTNITFNAESGLFQTPLGIVTQEGINDARVLLANIKTLILTDSSELKKELPKVISKYLMIIPQDVGMKIDINRLFPDDSAIQKQANILDSLEASYKAVMSAPPTADDNKSTQVEKVFEVDFDILNDDKEIFRIDRHYRSSANGQHVSYKFKIKNIYSIKIKSNYDSFQKSSVIGNVKELWHGTQKANLLSILKTGLKMSPPSSTYISGAMFSRGLYFSDQSTKSLNYSYGYWRGKYEDDIFMFLADVALGQSFTPSGPRSDLPLNGYDSTFAQAGRSGVSNNEYIVYRENQVNLKYLIEFQ